MRLAHVFWNGHLAGWLKEVPTVGYTFEYDSAYIANPELPAISLTLPKENKQYNSKHLFPCFFNLLSEGVNRDLQTRQLKIAENDLFGLLLATAQSDTIGAITLKPIEL